MTNPLEHLRSKFLTRCAETLVLLAGTDPHSPSEDARRAVHRLAGTAGMFGFDQLGRLAMAMDDQLHAGRPAELRNFDALLAQLRSLSAEQRSPGTAVSHSPD